MTHYQTLGLDNTATEKDIKDAYKKFAKKHHPDKHGNESQTVQDEHSEKFKSINEAYQTLIDSTKRSKYDNELRFGAPKSGGYGEYANNKYSDPFTNYKRRTVNPNIMENLAGLPFSELEDFNHKFSYQYEDMDSGKKINDNVEIKISLDGKYGSNGLIDIVKDTKGKQHLKFTIHIPHKGHAMYQGVRGSLTLFLFFPIPDEIKVILNPSTSAYDIVHKFDVSLYDIMFAEKIEVETYFKKKFKINIKKLESLSNIKCVMKNKGISGITGVGWNKPITTGSYIFNLNIKPLNIDRLEWLDKKKFKKMLEEISKTTED